MPIAWVVDCAGNGTIQFTETQQYVTGRWWAGLSQTDAKQYVLIPSEEPGLEGFKIKKTYPEDEPWYWLYVNGTRVATNGRQAANGDNFSQWKYAVWQFLSTEIETGIAEMVNGKWLNGKCVDGQISKGLYIINGKKVLVK